MEIRPHCSKAGVPAQGKQKETFLALKNHSGIAGVGSRASQSCAELKKIKRVNSSFSVVQIRKDSPLVVTLYLQIPAAYMG